MTETLTRLPLEPVPHDWGWYDVERLATADEMAAHPDCADCGDPLVAKVGGGVVQGTVLGYRFGPDDMFVWTAPLCHPCSKLAAVADGY